MLGVILWKDPAQGCAIVLCEDHGDLAYVGHASHPAALPAGVEKGDLIQFDVTEMNNLRLVTNPKPIARHAYPDIDKTVRRVASDQCASGRGPSVVSIAR